MPQFALIAQLNSAAREVHAAFLEPDPVLIIKQSELITQKGTLFAYNQKSNPDKAGLIGGIGFAPVKGDVTTKEDHYEYN